MSEGPSELGLKYFKPHYGEHLKRQLVGEGEHWKYSLAQTVMDLHNGVNRQTVNLEKVPRHQEEPIPDSSIPPAVIFATATTAFLPLQFLGN